MTNPLTTKLCGALQEAFNRPVMNMKDVERVEELVKLRVPEDRLMSWLTEGLSQRTAHGERRSMYQTLRLLEQRAQQWAQQHLAEGYELEQHAQGSAQRALLALEELTSAVERGSRERSTLQTAPLFDWLLVRLRQLVNAYRSDSSLELSALLSELDEALCAEVFRQLPSLAQQAQRESLKTLRRERNRSRPQDFSRALRSVTWAQLRAELQLPALYLPLYGSW